MSVETFPGGLLHAAESYLPIALHGYLKPICSECPRNMCGDMEVLKTHAAQLLEKMHKDMPLFDTSQIMLTSFRLAQQVTNLHWTRTSLVSEISYSIPRLLRSLKNEEYLQKNDIFPILLDSLRSREWSKNDFGTCPHLWKVPFFFLKIHERRLNGTFEFFKWSLETRGAIEKVFNKNLSRLWDAHKPASVDVLQQLRKLLPSDSHLREFAEIQLILEIIPDAQMFTCSIILESLNSVIKAFPAIFLPDRETPSIKKPKFVRMFVDGPNKFVMEDELFGPEKNEYNILTTIDAKSALLMAQRLTVTTGEHIEFIIHPEILRTEHRTVPIHTPDGKLCKLAVDVMLELLQDLIFGWHVFQTQDKWENIEAFFKQVEGYFLMDQKAPYFIQMDTIAILNGLVKSYLAKFQSAKESKAPRLFPKFCCVTDNKESIPDGMTIKEARDQWNGASRLVRSAFEKYERDQTEHSRGSCEILHTHYQFMLMFLCGRLPKIADFIHNQYGCHKLPVCKQCSRDAPVAEATTQDLPPATCSEASNGAGDVLIDAPIETPVSDVPQQPHDKPPKHPLLEEITQFAQAQPGIMNLDVSSQGNIVLKRLLEIYDREQNLLLQEQEKGAEEGEAYNKKMYKMLDTIKEKNREIEGMLEDHLKEQEKWHQEVKNLNIEADDLERERDDLQQQLELTRKDLLVVKADAERKIKQEREKEQNSRMKLQEELKQVKGRMEKLREEKEAQRSAHKAASSKNVEQNLLIQQIQGELEQMKQEKTGEQQVIRELREQLAKDQSRVETLEQENQELQEQLRRAKEPRVDMESVLKDLQNQRDKLRMEDPAKEVAKLANKLISITQDSQVRQRTKREMDEFSTKLLVYVEAIEMNIAMIQSDPNIHFTQLIPIPELPELSQSFFADYERAMKQMEVDSECMICLDELKTEETEKSTCDGCKKVFHEDCLNTWKQRNPVCPNCRKTLQ